MNEKQRLALAELFCGWLEKASVAFMIVGMFQPEHMFGGLIGAVTSLLTAIVLKVRIAR